ncbi:glycosyltransferase family 4 protein [Moritella sp. Urea-trap-13]|uniref:glycosyltransferase family 4 protein n=1 Tax=Moritella sp. Urea-trap-13 TaxID=2058327 RepID=UPI0018E2CAF4|nr:glycosyltransferase family 4 protein [Moritella sp. Urea-trap-13]
MKIYNFLYLSECNDMGGAEHSLFRLMQGISDLGHNVILASPRHGVLKRKCKDNSIETIDIEFPQLKGQGIKAIFNIVSFLFKIKKIIKNNNVDIVHSNTARTRFYLFFISIIFNVKTVAHVRDLQKNRFEFILLFVINKTIAISDVVKNMILSNSSGMCENKLIKIYNGVEDLSDFNSLLNLRTKHNISENVVLIGIIGRIEDWKRQDIFIEAANLLVEYKNELAFFIVGDAFREEDNEFKEKLIKLKSKSPMNIIMTGHVDNPFDYLKNFDLLICPSDNEPFGRVIIEAMSMKKNIISSDNGGGSEIIKSHRQFSLFKVNDSNALAKSINEMLSCDSIEKIVNDNYLNYKNNFSLQSNIKQTEKVYGDI